MGVRYDSDSSALLAYGFAVRNAHPAVARRALRRGMVLARDSGNRFNESALALGLSSLEAAHGDPLAAFDYVTVATRNYHDSGSTTMIRAP